MVRLERLEEEKLKRYLGLIDSASRRARVLLELLSLAARIEGGRYEPVTARGRLARAGARRARPAPARRSSSSPMRSSARSRRSSSRRGAARRRRGERHRRRAEVMFEPVARERRSDRPRRGAEGPRRGGRRDAHPRARRRGRPRRRAAHRHAADGLGSPMSLPAGTHTLGPENGTLSVRTGAPAPLRRPDTISCSTSPPGRRRSRSVRILRRPASRSTSIPPLSACARAPAGCSRSAPTTRRTSRRRSTTRS